MLPLESAGPVKLPAGGCRMPRFLTRTACIPESLGQSAFNAAGAAAGGAAERERGGGVQRGGAAGAADRFGGMSVLSQRHCSRHVLMHGARAAEGSGLISRRYISATLVSPSTY